MPTDIKDKILARSVFLLSLVLFAYVVIRAFTLSFTHDESITFTIADYNSNWRNTANNHLLNSWLMKISLFLFGDSELSCRLPNVLSYPFYLFFSFAIAKRLQGYVMVIACFILLNFNPFVLEFFSLARGYGLSLALLLATIHYFMKYLRDKKSDVLLRASVLCILSVLANFVVLNFYIGLIAIAALVEWWRSSGSALQRIKLLIATHKWFIIVNFLSIIFILFRLFKLKGSGELYFGEKQNIWDSTFGSLINSSLYAIDHGSFVRTLISAGIMIAIVLPLLLIVIDLIKNRSFKPSSLFFAAVALSLLFPMAENFVMDMPFPTQRTAIMYIPLLTITLFFSLDEVGNMFERATHKIISVLVIPVALFSVIHSVKAANFSGTYCYSSDANTKQLMEDMRADFEKDHGYQPVYVGCDWLFEPTINYYKTSRELDWLEWATRKGLTNRLYEYYICFANEKELIPEHEKLVVVSTYSQTNTVLLRRNFRRLLATKTVSFDTLPGKVPFNDVVIPFDAIPANSEIVIKFMPKEEFKSDMKAYVLFYGSEDWQNKTIIEERIIGNEHLFETITPVALEKPVLVFRNWQAKPTLPAADIRVMIFARP